MAAKVAHAVPGRVRLRVDEVSGDPEHAVMLRDQLSEIDGVQEIVIRRTTGSVLVNYEDGRRDSVLTAIGESVPVDMSGIRGGWFRVADAARAAQANAARDASDGASTAESAAQDTGGSTSAGGSASSGGAASAGSSASADAADSTSDGGGWGAFFPGSEELVTGLFSAVQNGGIKTVLLEYLRGDRPEHGQIDPKRLVPLVLLGMGLLSLFRAWLRDRRLPLPEWYDYVWFAFASFVALNPVPGVADARESDSASDRSSTNATSSQSEAASSRSEAASSRSAAASSGQSGTGAGAYSGTQAGSQTETEGTRHAGTSDSPAGSSPAGSEGPPRKKASASASGTASAENSPTGNSADDVDDADGGDSQKCA